MILQRYILRELAASFVLAFITISLIIFIGFGTQQYRRLEGLGFLFLLQSTPFLFCYAVRFSLPASMLIASVLVYARLSAENEIVAIRAGGVPLWRVVNPAMAMGLGVSLLFLLFNDHVAPLAIQQQRQLARRGLVNTLTTPPPLGSSLIISDYRIIYKAYRGGVFEELSLLQGAGTEEIKIIWAGEAKFQAGDRHRPASFELHDVTGLTLLPQKSPPDWPVLLARKVEYPLDIEEMIQKPWRLFEMPTIDLLALLDIPGSRTPSKTVLAERHQRIAWAMGPFVLTLLGIPCGILLRKGSRMAGFGASIPGGTAYLLLATAGQALASKASLPLLATIWFADALFFALGVVLTWRLYRI